MYFEIGSPDNCQTLVRLLSLKQSDGTATFDMDGMLNVAEGKKVDLNKLIFFFSMTVLRKFRPLRSFRAQFSFPLTDERC